MIAKKKIEILNQREDTEILTREYVRTDGRVLLYITSINGVHYTTDQQYQAKRHLNLLWEVQNNDRSIN